MPTNGLRCHHTEGKVCLKPAVETGSDCSYRIVAYTYAAEGHTLLKALTEKTVFCKNATCIWIQKTSLNKDSIAAQSLQRTPG